MSSGFVPTRIATVRVHETNVTTSPNIGVLFHSTATGKDCALTTLPSILTKLDAGDEFSVKRLHAPCLVNWIQQSLKLSMICIVVALRRELPISTRS